MVRKMYIFSTTVVRLTIYYMWLTMWLFFFPQIFWSVIGWIRGVKTCSCRRLPALAVGIEDSLYLRHCIGPFRSNFTLRQVRGCALLFPIIRRGNRVSGNKWQSSVVHSRVMKWLVTPHLILWLFLQCPKQHCRGIKIALLSAWASSAPAMIRGPLGRYPAMTRGLSGDEACFLRWFFLVSGVYYLWKII